MTISSICSNLWRKKTVITSNLHDSKLKRCLGLLDLIGLGIGSSLGVGVYIMTSYAISKDAGPSFVISVIIAGLATLFAGLCYAEFSARLPRAGSSYYYTYVTLGEFCGFVIGWNMILEHIITTCIAAKAWSQYLDYMLNGTIKSVIDENMSWNGGEVWGESPDIVAFLIILVITLIVAMKARLSTVLLMVLTFFNILIVMCFVCIGYFHVKHDNWTEPPGFFAHGFTGVLSGASTLIFTFTNIEAITSASEEAKEPTRVTSSAITYSIFICSIVYFCISTSATLSLHHFPEDSLIALPHVLSNLHIHGASSVIAVGGLIGLLASLIGSLFYLTRQVYSISNDRLILKCLSRVSSKWNIPVYSVILLGLVSAIISLVLEFEILLQVVSIGTLLSYSVLAVSVICVRYQPGTVGLYVEYEDPDDINFMQCTDFNYSHLQLDANKSNVSAEERFRGCDKIPKHTNGYSTGASALIRKSVSFDDKYRLDRMSEQTNYYQSPRDSTYTRLDSVVSSTSNGNVSGLLRLPSDIVLEPTESTWKTAAIGLLIYITCSCVLSIITLYAEFLLHLDSWWMLLIIFVFSILLISATVLIVRQPENRTKLYFRTPYVPFIPLLAILINVFLLASLSFMCWIRFLLWMALGLLLYFGYGYRNSLEYQTDEQEVVLYEITDESNAH
ncbi:cationic amino acid transporter 2-like isoform X2 [Ruditapes philippinarum]|nr:cationic amino acid transporter 2-like isoform X2 [Ruditapes philippinarum]XP_060571805.1 cationic amino acid transporter 2-like isoform X2 [Ruditapes philippinarum]